jgi:uncharacterized protein with PQ loop repeat
MKSDKIYTYISYGAIACTTFLLLGQVAAAYPIARWSVIALIFFLLVAIAIGAGTSSWLAMFIGKDEEFTKQYGIVSQLPVIAAIALLLGCALFGAFAIGG